MGLFSSIQKLALTPSAYIGKQILKIVKPSSSIANQPVSTTTTQLQKTTAGKVLGTAIAGTAAALAVAAAPSGTAAAVGKAAAKHPIKAAGGTLLGIAALNVVAEKPQAIYKVPSEAVSYASDVGGLIASPSGEGIVGLVKEHPVAAGLTAAAAALVIGKTAAPAIASTLQTQAIKEQTEAIKGQTGGYLGAAPLETGELATLPTNTTGVMTRETTSIKSKPRKRKKASLGAQGQKISQRVNVMVSHKNVTSVGNKKLINYAYN